MLTAAQPHPGNDCVINPEPFLKLLLTAGGENGTQTVSAHLSPKHRGGWFDPSWLSVIVKDRATRERGTASTHAQERHGILLNSYSVKTLFSPMDETFVGPFLLIQHNSF